MVGSSIVRQLEGTGQYHIITTTHKELDLTSQDDVKTFFAAEKIDKVVLAAAKVGGIYANNTYPAQFIYENLMIQANVIHQAYLAGVKHLLFLGSSCIYPKFAPQPMKEEHLLTGVLEPTNEPYAIAKIAGIKMCNAYNRQYGTCYRSVMPTNLYGPGDNYHLENSHVLPAMIRKFHLAKLASAGDLAGIKNDIERYGAVPEDICTAIGLVDGELKGGVEPKVVLWGSGTPRREFLHVDDMAAASIFVMGMEQEEFDNAAPYSFFNVGTGFDITIKEVAQVVKEVVGFEGEVVYDAEKPDGTPRKLLDTSAINSQGWQPKFGLRDGLEDAYNWYLMEGVKSFLAS